MELIFNICDPKAFELWCAGPFNLSHASITSPKALEALCNLHKTDLALFNKLSNDSGQPASVFDANDKAPFLETPDDASDIPLEVIQQHLALGPQGTNTGYVVDEDGLLSCLSAAEDADSKVEDLEEVEVSMTPMIQGAVESQVLGSGHCTKKGTCPYGGSRWDIDEFIQSVVNTWSNKNLF